MNTKVNKKLIKEQLDHGDLTLIATKAGLHRNTVYHYFNGRTKKFNRKIEVAAIGLISEKLMVQKKFAESVQNSSI